MDDDTYPWPKDGDRPFIEDGDALETARLVFSRADWSCYAKSYKRAGDLIIERIMTRQPVEDIRDPAESTNPDMLVYPVVFMYRHYLELSMKLLITYGSLLGCDARIPRHHKLDALWGECRHILEETWPGKQSKVVDVIEQCICQFAQIDPGSTAFRYPAASEGDQALGQPDSINLRNLSEVIDRVDGFLDAVDAMLIAWMDGKDNAQYPLMFEDAEDQIWGPYWSGDL